MTTIPVRVIVSGDANGPALVLTRPLGFWGGVASESGRIIDPTHPQCGASVTGTILVMPGGRGSCSSSSVLAECIRRGTAPAGIVLADPDPILLVGSLVAQSLYGRVCPIAVCSIDLIRPGAKVVLRTGSSSLTID